MNNKFKYKIRIFFIVVFNLLFMLMRNLCNCKEGLLRVNLNPDHNAINNIFDVTAVQLNHNVLNTLLMNMLRFITIISINTLAVSFLAAEYLLVNLVQDEANQEPKQRIIRGRRLSCHQNIYFMILQD